MEQKSCYDCKYCPMCPFFQSNLSIPVKSNDPDYNTKHKNLFIAAAEYCAEFKPEQGEKGAQ